MRRIRDIAPLAALIAALALPASAHAVSAGAQAVIKDCSDDGQFSRTYPAGDLSEADHNLPTDIREYTDCKSLIEAALARQGGSGSPTGGGPGGATAGGAGGAGGAATTPSGAAGTPAAVAALNRATAEAEGGRASITANGQTIRPLASGLNQVPGAANALPSSVLAAIVAVMALCALGAIAATWRRWPALARAPLRLFRR